MKITVFGATGGIGRQLVAQALNHGHDVTAVVRDAARLPISDVALHVVTVPGLEQPDLLRSALIGSHAVLSAVGPRGRKDGPVASTAVRTILNAMDSAGVRRLVAVSAAPVGPVPDGESALNRWLLLPLVGRLLRSVYTDLGEMEAQLLRSSAAWTVIRPPKLVNKPLTGIYRTTLGGNVPRGISISRADAAHLMLAALDQPATVTQAVGVAY
ncbi:MAG TPA: NAD(P)H-binding protein [Mycobacterium sp.]|nr:NAD(P)H-binding protein [Mycobacterium sp.]